tara:strand:- start:614 stop:730 length:117 start_codon:yes stop_codon:yes gene_type:complete
MPIKRPEGKSLGSPRKALKVDPGKMVVRNDEFIMRRMV